MMSAQGSLLIGGMSVESLSNHMSALGTLMFAESLICLFHTCVSIALLMLLRT